MNQILFIQDKKTINPQDTKKIVLVFAALIIVFGFILLIQGVYGVNIYYQNKKMNSEKPEQTNIQLSQTTDGNVLITVESQTAISELIYYWNSDASQTISQNGRTAIQETITIPAGENTLTVKTIDANGNEKMKQATFTLNVDKPTINVTSVVGNNVKIVVESKVDISYVTYKWNTENENKLDMLTFQDKTKFEKQIPIPRGTNTLLVTAVDIYGNKTEKSQEVKGVPITIKPVIRGDSVFFEVTSDETIKQVDFVFNGTKYTISSNVIGNSNKVSHKLTLRQGWNYLTINATTISNVSSSSGLCKYEYKP